MRLFITWSLPGCWVKKFLLGFLAAVIQGCATGDAAPEARPRLLVVNKADSTLAAVDPSEFRVVGKARTGFSPHEVALSLDGRLAYVSNYGTARKPGSSLSVINVETMKEVKRIDLDGLSRPHGLVQSNGQIYFTAEGSGAIARFNTALNRIDWILKTGQEATHMLAMTPDQKKIYTANIGSNTVTAIELAEVLAESSIKHIAVGNGPEGLDVSPDGRELWVAHRGDGNISILNTANDTVKEVIPAGAFPIRVQFTPRGERVLVTDFQTGELLILDAKSRGLVKRLAVGARPVGIQVTPDGTRAFVAATGDNRVVVVDLESLEVVGSVSPGKEPDGMAWRSP